ncbi:MAG: hypothetical protein QOD39_196 [Mycobacterium sp.]|nr:hypothetical protein [Mycobacterium sp.]
MVPGLRPHSTTTRSKKPAARKPTDHGPAGVRRATFQQRRAVRPGPRSAAQPISGGLRSKAAPGSTKSSGLPALPGRAKPEPWTDFTGAQFDARNYGTCGLTELIIINAGVSLGVLDSRLFTMMVLMALVTTALAAPFLPNAPASPNDLADRPATPSDQLQPA